MGRASESESVTVLLSSNGRHTVPFQTFMKHQNQLLKLAITFKFTIILTETLAMTPNHLIYRHAPRIDL